MRQVLAATFFVHTQACEKLETIGWLVIGKGISSSAGDASLLFIPPPLGGNRIIHLEGICEVISGAQQLTGKILSRRYLAHVPCSRTQERKY